MAYIPSNRLRDNAEFFDSELISPYITQKPLLRQGLMIITRHCTLEASTFVRLQIAQRRNFFERGVNTVRWARLRHCHSAVSLYHRFLSLGRALSLALAVKRHRGMERRERDPPRTNVAHRAARPTDCSPVRGRPSDRAGALEQNGNAASNNSERNGRASLYEMPRPTNLHEGGRPKQISFL